VGGRAPSSRAAGDFGAGKAIPSFTLASPTPRIFFCYFYLFRKESVNETFLPGQLAQASICDPIHRDRRISFVPNGAGYYFIGGTSEGSPQWAGVVADANQLAQHALGFLNPSLYKIGHSKFAARSYHDITVGNNGYNNVPGYNATPGWDLATGWGTPKVTTLAVELAVLSHAH
jgi:hypothetical protein